MRTTVTLDDDLYQALERQARKTDQPLKQVLNAAVRAGLAIARQPGKAARPFRVKAIHSSLQPGIDPLRLNQLFDELETGDTLNELLRQR